MTITQTQNTSMRINSKWGNSQNYLALERGKVPIVLITSPDAILLGFIAAGEPVGCFRKLRTKDQRLTRRYRFTGSHP